jgi:hypothetical protein
LRTIGPALAALTAEKDRYCDLLTKTQQALLELTAEVQALKAAVALRRRNDVSQATRLCELQRGLDAERDPARPLH